ncbi:T9SS type A sorting domain-containing protein [Chryseobacterium daecheongense]|uniref:T9SS type A sorting domain-containing protein n=1 Tax=Chryseobacterium daecheongense TaxID=192389 RepID=UPI001FD6CB5B|nr:T9SS type A sorting domain-containing protein [Chryseobacterium daecheongense]UOU98801.1 T9SS type A sorting domain-containing protein [Chryseobacterium daecheongense]
MKRTIFFAICSLFISIFSFGQTSTEQFETESHSSASFTDNGVIFNILSHVGTFDIQANYPGTGWNGTANDNRYIDNSASAQADASFSIKTTSNLFKVNRFWIFLSNTSLNQNVVGTLTITGKLSGVTKFTQTKTTGFATGLGTTNGYTLIDMTNLNGQNYSNIVIDQLQITLGGAFTYGGLDSFTWVKDSNVVLATNEIKSQKSKLSIYPNPTHGSFIINSNENSKAEIYDQTGKMVKSLEIRQGENREDISELPTGTYLIQTSSGSYKIIKN